MTFDELLSIYFKHKNLRADTEWSYRKVVRQLLLFYPGIKPSELTKDMVIEWRSHSLKPKNKKKAISVVTWNNRVSHMRSLYNFSYSENLLPLTGNPFAKMQTKAGKKGKKTLTTKELDIIFNYLEKCIQEEEIHGSDAREVQGAVYPASYFLPLCATLRYTGIRKNQLLNIRLRDVDLVNRVIFLQSHASKNHNEHKVPIIDKLAPFLTLLIKRALKLKAVKDDLLFDLKRFDSLRGKDLVNASGFDAFFRRISTDLGFRISPHRFRHTLATNLMRSPDRNLPMVKNLLGHQSINSTMEYIDVNVNEIKDVLEKNLEI